MQREAERILRVREDSAAALMEIQPLHVTTQTLVSRMSRSAFNTVRRAWPARCSSSTPTTLWSARSTCRALIAAAPEARIGTLMQPVKWQVDEFTTREEIAAGIGRYNVNTLPVVNLQGRFSGIIRSENLFDAVEQDALSDLQTMVGAGKDEHALSTVWTDGA